MHDHDEEIHRLAAELGAIGAEIFAAVQHSLKATRKRRQAAAHEVAKLLKDVEPENAGCLLSSLAVALQQSPPRSRNPGHELKVSPTGFSVGDQTAYGLKFSRGRTSVSAGAIVSGDLTRPRVTGGAIAVEHKY